MLYGHKLVPRAFAVRDRILSEIDGRAADQGVSLPWIAIMAALSGAGNHCEIGTLFGASAIAVALLKKELGQAGNVVCIDPYEPREVSINPHSQLDPATLEGNHDKLMANAAKFGLDNIIHIQARSNPWPEEIKGWRFVSGYIDGDHTGDTPYLDFLHLADCGCSTIAFDNFEEGYPDVVKAAHKVFDSGEWFPYFKEAVFLAFRRPLPPRETGISLGLL